MNPTVTNAPKPTHLRVKPTQDTPFRIDYTWWEREGRDLRTYLVSQLPAEQRERFESGEIAGEVDWIDPDTAEVRRLDALNIAIQEAIKDPNFTNAQTTLVDAVFRVFLANSNKALTVNELAQQMNRPALTILKTLAGTTGVIYKGLRPVIEE